MEFSWNKDWRDVLFRFFLECSQRQLNSFEKNVLYFIKQVLYFLHRFGVEFKI